MSVGTARGRHRMCPMTVTRTTRDGHGIRPGTWGPNQTARPNSGSLGVSSSVVDPNPADRSPPVNRVWQSLPSACVRHCGRCDAAGFRGSSQMRV